MVDKIDVEATHLTKRKVPQALVCELYPGIFVVDGGGTHYASTSAHLFEPLPKNSGRTFPIDEIRAERAADMYETARENEQFRAEQASRSF